MSTQGACVVSHPETLPPAAAEAHGDGVPGAPDAGPAAPDAATAQQKMCRNCGENKPRTDFHRNKATHDQLEQVCKPCKSQRDAARRHARSQVVPCVDKKTCKHCTTEKEAAEFPANKLTVDGLHTYCKTCKLLLDSQSRQKRRRGSGDEGGAAVSDVAPQPPPAACTAALEPQFLRSPACGLLSEATAAPLQSSAIAVLPQSASCSPQAESLVSLVLGSPPAHGLLAAPALPPGTPLPAAQAALASIGELTALAPVASKACWLCGCTKAAGEFVADRLSADGLMSYCATCCASAASGAQAAVPQLAAAAALPAHHAEVSTAPAAKRAVPRTPVMEPTVESKACSRCREVKIAGEFHRDCNKPDGLRGRCRGCEAATGQARRATRTKTLAPTVEAKNCRRCKAYKPAADFPRKKERSDGLDSYCKACNCAATAERTQRKGPVLAPRVASKVCGRCRFLLRAAEFPARRYSTSDGLYSYCYACKAAVARQRAAGPDAPDADAHAAPGSVPKPAASQPAPRGASAAMEGMDADTKDAPLSGSAPVLPPAAGAEPTMDMDAAGAGTASAARTLQADPGGVASQAQAPGCSAACNSAAAAGGGAAAATGGASSMVRQESLPRSTCGLPVVLPRAPTGYGASPLGVATHEVTASGVRAGNAAGEGGAAQEVVPHGPVPGQEALLGPARQLY